MRKLLLTMLAVACCAIVYSQPYHYKIAIVGSSTAFGTGASPIDSSWVNLTQFYLRELKEIDTIYNSAVGGTFTGQGAGAEPDTGIAWVMNTYNPDVVIASYASNDAAADVPVDSTMQHLRTIYNMVTSAGKICYITTPHPRDFFTHYQDSLQLDVRDSTFAEFGAFSLDFWHCLVASDSVSIAPQYNFDDVHVNNAGHQQLFQVVKNANILSAFIPLALATDSLTAVPQNADILLNWTAVDNGAIQFTLQRSSDGNTYTDIDEQTVAANIPGTHYSWKDPAPATGHNYYRLITGNDGNTSYSPVVSVEWRGASWGIGGIYLPQGGSQLTITIGSEKTRNITLSVFDATGRLLTSTPGIVTTPSTRFTLDIPNLAQGQYFLRAVSTDGRNSTKAFLKW